MMWGRVSQKTASVNGSLNEGVKSLLVSSEKVYDFGTISMVNGNVEKKFTITNPTEKEITVRQIITSCMCTIAFLEGGSGEEGPFGMPGHGGPVAKVNEIINSGESRYVRVVYNPNAHGPVGVGSVDRFVEVTDSNGKVLSLEIKAVVTP